MGLDPVGSLFAEELVLVGIGGRVWVLRQGRSLCETLNAIILGFQNELIVIE